MSKIANFEIPSDYGCLALINPDTFVSFINEEWLLEELVNHFISEMNQNHMIAWGCVHGNWKVEFYDKFSKISGYEESLQNIFSNGNLYLVNYDSLTYAAQFSDERLPLDEMSNFHLSVSPGHYLCRVIQLFDSSEAESEMMFYQESPHFIVELEKSEKEEDSSKVHHEIPWFPVITKKGFE